MEALGTFAPVGRPSEKRMRIDAGASCVVDLKQSYSISGTLTGSLGGDVDGMMVLGQGLAGELHVRGNFGDGRLSCEGWVDDGLASGRRRTD